MAQFIARNGISISGKTYISDVSVSTNPQSILIIDGTEVKYTEVGSLPNTYVTGGTYNNSTGIATFTNNDNNSFDVTGFFTSADTINIYTTDSSFTSERFANLDSYKLHLTGGTVGINVLDFVPTDTPPTGNQGQVYFDSDFDTLTIYNSINGTSLQVGQEMWFRVKNQSGSGIPDGTLVMSSGSDGNSGRITIVSAITDGTYPNDYIMGITTHSIANGEDGWVTEFGIVKGIDTRGQNGETWIDGTILYGDPNRPGGLTSAIPSSPNNRNPMAIVLKASSGGSLFVRPTFDHNLEYLVTGATTGQVITFNGSIYEPQNPNNIYNNDGVLKQNRVVNLDNYSLTFTGGSTFHVSDVDEIILGDDEVYVESGQEYVRIGNTGYTSSPNAVLEVSSNSKGMLFPRITMAQRDNMNLDPSRDTGLIVYQTDEDEGLYIYKSFGWVQII